MSFKETKAHKQYSIALKTPSGNTVGYINLNNQFVKAVMRTTPEAVTAKAVEEMYAGGFQAYLDTLTVEVSAVEAEPTVDIGSY